MPGKGNHPCGDYICTMAARKKQDSLEFKAPLERFPSGLKAFYVTVPVSVPEVFGTRASVRMKGTINGIEVERALIPTGNGMHHILVPQELRKKARLRLGDPVSVKLKRDENPDEVEIPEELIAALEMEPKILEGFLRLSPSVKRGMAQWINSGKKQETRIERALEILRRFQSGKAVFGGRLIELK